MQQICQKHHVWVKNINVYVNHQVLCYITESCLLKSFSFGIPNNISLPPHLSVKRCLIWYPMNFQSLDYNDKLKEISKDLSFLMYPWPRRITREICHTKKCWFHPGHLWKHVNWSSWSTAVLVSNFDRKEKSKMLWDMFFLFPFTFLALLFI